MLGKIIRFSIENKLIIGLLTLFLIGYGAYQFTKLPIDAVPDITDNQVQIITVAPSLGAPDVERLITFPVEQLNSNIPGIEFTRSISRFGLSVVTIVFDDDVDVYWARQQVAERLQEVQNLIPKNFGIPEMAPVTTGLGEVYQYTVRPAKGFEDKYDAMELRTIQDWIVRRQLLGVKGVADVASFGGFVKQYEIAVDPAKLMANNVTISEVFSALENNNQNTGGAYIEKGPTVLFIRSEGLVGNTNDIRNIVVKNLSNGFPILIRDIAEVGYGSSTRFGAMTYNGEMEVSGAVVMMLKGANSNEVIKNIKKRVEQIRKSLPEGIVIDPFLDRTKMVNNSIKTVSKNLMEGALIVIFVLVLFLGNLRAGFLVASVIPLSMLFAVIMMNYFGVSGNLMSLGALDFGLIVDGAVIIVEATMHGLIRSRTKSDAIKLSQKEMNIEVYKSASTMMNSAVFGQIIILIVYLPIFTLQGIEGKMFLPMAQTVAFALIGAFLLSLTYIPMMSSLVLSKKVNHNKTISDKMMLHIENLYKPSLETALRKPKLVVSAAVLAFVLSLFVLSRLGGEFIPSLPEGDFAVETRVMPGSNLNTSIEGVSRASKILLEKFPEVEQVVGKTGSSEIPTDPMPLEASDLMVILKHRDEWTSASTYEGLIEKMSLALEDVPGVSFGFMYPVAMRFNELMTGARQDVVCKIFGENLDTLAMSAKKLGAICHEVEGAEDIYVESVTGMPQIVIEYDRTAIAQYGLNIKDINSAVNTAFAGQSSGQVFEGERRFDLVVRLTGEQRQNLADVQNLLIPTSLGSQIPLHQVAHVEIVTGPYQIQRENTFRRIIVGFNVRGRDVESVVNELKQRVEKEIKFPPAYYITYGGTFENLEKARRRLSLAVPLSLVLILIMLYFAFGSLKHGILIFSAIPLSAIGGILALYLRGMPFSISAGVGFIALFGVSVLNGIVLIAEFNRLKKSGMNDLREIVRKGTCIRLRPVLMTALVASLGFLPMALSNGEGAEVQRPLASVVIGGLMVATFLTLMVLPILYILFEKVSEKRKIRRANRKLLISVFLLLSSFGLKAQEYITLEAAIDTAMKNNYKLRNERLHAEYLEKLKGSAWNLPNTDVSLNVGQMNSAYQDRGLSVAQSMKFPSVYSRQRSLKKQESLGGELTVAMKENELRKEVSIAYYELIYYDQKRKLLETTDSIFAAFLRNAELRFKAGESNILEETTARTQRGQIRIQLAQLESDEVIAALHFRWLLNSKENYKVRPSQFRLSNYELPDTSVVKHHPYVRLLDQQMIIGKARFKVERSKLSPELFALYNGMSMQGFGADNVLYDRSTLFNSWQVGVSIPLFFGAQRSQISAEKVKWDLTKNQYQSGLQEMRNEYQTIVSRYNQHLLIVDYFESTAIESAEIIFRSANEQFMSGSINYLEWVLLTNSAISIKSDYIDAVMDLNKSILEIQSFKN